MFEFEAFSTCTKISISLRESLMESVFCVLILKKNQYNLPFVNVLESIHRIGNVLLYDRSYTCHEFNQGKKLDCFLLMSPLLIIHSARICLATNPLNHTKCSSICKRNDKIYKQISIFG